MRVDYEVIWTENNEMKFKQFSYDDGSFPLPWYLPDDVYNFFAELQNKHIPVVVAVGEMERTGTGIIRYCGSNPVYD